jgi:hypothetical protein
MLAGRRDSLLHGLNPIELRLGQRLVQGQLHQQV